jgi:hypothetical protein
MSLYAVYTRFLQYVKFKLDLLHKFRLLGILKAKRWKKNIG